MADRPCLEIAARMLSITEDPDPKALHPDLSAFLSDVDNLCAAYYECLDNVQLIAALIVSWKIRHPNERPYMGD